MKIKNIDGLSADALEREVVQGGRFVYFPYVISLIVFTFKRTSNVYLIRKGENILVKSIPFSLLSFLFGWWGLPFGPKFTFQSLRTNFNGGKEVTDEVMSTIEGHKLFREAQLKNAVAK